MRRVSSSFYPRIVKFFSMLIFGVATIVGFVATYIQLREQRPAVALFCLLAYVVFLIIRYLIQKYWSVHYVDEVFDCGDSILVRHEGREQRFQLNEFSGVIGISDKPSYISIELISQITSWGKTIVFCPSYYIYWYPMIRYTIELRSRIKAANSST